MNAVNSKTATDQDELLRLLTRHGQQQLLRFWSDLSDAQRQRLAAQVALIDFPLVARLRGSAAGNEDWAALARRAEPPNAFRLDGSGNRFTAAEARGVGEKALRSGQIGAVLVAGGQGTRLGFDHPKGMYKIGPISGASLFQILLEKLLAVSRRYGAAVPLYLMTSPATHTETEQYLSETNRFRLPSDSVRVFCQGVMPAVDAASGQVLLSGKDEVALSPDGHGGMLAALDRSGGLAEIERRSVKHLFYFQVDNPLVQMCDPTFVGYHILSGSEMSTLAVSKRDPTERVGNIVQIDGCTRIIEYSDLPTDVAEQRSTDGSLRLWAGNTAIHILDVSFLRRACGDAAALPYHIARKKVPSLNEKGDEIEPATPNAIKFERFIFDLLPLASEAIVVETDAARTFAPVKNAPGEKRDSPETCQAAMTVLYREWLTAAGAKVAPNVPVEISPLFALDEEELRSKIRPGTVIDRPTYFNG